jgi:hypothetical protein
MYVHDDDLKDEVLNWVNSILGMLYIILPKRIFSKNNAKVRFSRETTKGNNRKMRYFYQKNCFKECSINPLRSKATSSMPVVINYLYW